MKFLVIHPIPAGTTREDVIAHMKSAQTDPDIRGYRSFLNLTSGKGACVLESPSREKLVGWLKKNNLTYDNIFEVELESYRGELVEAETPVTAGV
jgi:hypothetical protein